MRAAEEVARRRGIEIATVYAHESKVLKRVVEEMAKLTDDIPAYHPLRERVGITTQSGPIAYERMPLGGRSLEARGRDLPEIDLPLVLEHIEVCPRCRPWLADTPDDPEHARLAGQSRRVSRSAFGVPGTTRADRNSASRSARGRSQ